MTLKKPYQTLLFDLDNTLLDFHLCEQKSLTALHNEHFKDSLPHSAFLNSFKDINASLWRQVNFGKLTPTDVKTERFKRLIHKHGLQCTAEDLSHHYLSLQEQYVEWLPGAKQALDKLKPHYQIGIITNGLTQTQKDKCRTLGISNWCECMVISEEVGLAKPDPAIFKHAFDKLKTQAKDCLMFGDSLHSDHQGAINTGMDFCWITYRKPHKSEKPKQKPTYEAEHLADFVQKLI